MFCFMYICVRTDSVAFGEFDGVCAELVGRQTEICFLALMLWLTGLKVPTNSSGNTRSQSSQLAEPLGTDPGIKVELVRTS